MTTDAERKSLRWGAGFLAGATALALSFGAVVSLLPHGTDVRAYGCRPNDGLDDSAAVRAAALAASAAGGGEIVLPAGTLDWTGAQVELPGNCTLRGQGRVATLIRPQAGRSTPVVSIDGKGDVDVRDFSIVAPSGAAATGTAYGVYVRGDAADVNVDRVTVVGMFRPFQVAGGEGTVAGTCKRINFDRCRGNNSPQQFGFNLDDCDGVTLDRCVAYNNGLDGLKARKKTLNVTATHCDFSYNGTFLQADGADVFAGGDTTTLDSCLLRGNTGNGVTVKTGDLNKAGAGNADTYGLVRNVVLKNLRTQANAVYGAYVTLSDPLDTAEPLVDGVVIDGGYFEGDQTGLYLNAHNVTVNHPVVRKSLQHGIVTSSQAFDVELNDVLVAGAGQSADNTYHGIVIAGSSNVRVNRGLVVGKVGDQVHSDADLTALSATRTRYGCDIQPSSTAVWVNFLRGRQIASNIVNNQVATGTAIVDQLRGGDAEGQGFGGVGSLYRRDYSSIGEDGWKVWKVKTRGAPNSVGGTVGTVRDWSWLVQGAPVSALPTAGADVNGVILRKEGGAGVADTMWVCTKDAGGSFTWKQISAN